MKFFYLSLVIVFLLIFNIAFPRTNISTKELIEINIIGKNIKKTYYVAYSKSTQSFLYYDEVY